MVFVAAMENVGLNWAQAVIQSFILLQRWTHLTHTRYEARVTTERFFLAEALTQGGAGYIGFKSLLGLSIKS